MSWTASSDSPNANDLRLHVRNLGIQTCPGSSTPSGSIHEKLTDGPEPAHGDGELISWAALPGSEDLVVRQHVVEWFIGGISQRRFGFPDELVSHALFAFFNDPAHADSDETTYSSKSTNKPVAEIQSRAIVIFVSDSAHLYFISGAHFIVSIPFAVKTVFASDRGLIIERDDSQDGAAGHPTKSLFLNLEHSDWQPSTGAPKMPRFFSLVDPLAELGVVIQSERLKRTSGTAAGFVSSETLVFVSEQMQISRPGIAATYDSATQMLNVYQFRYLRRAGNNPTRRRTMSRRHSSMVHALNDDSISVDLSLSLDAPSSGRISSSRADTSLQLDRMGPPGFDYPDGASGGSAISGPFLSWWYDVENLRQEVEFTLIEAFPFKGPANKLRAFDIEYGDKVNDSGSHQLLAVVNKAEESLLVLQFSINHYRWRFEGSSSYTVKDAIPLRDEVSVIPVRPRMPSLLLVRTDGTLALLSCKFRLYSPRLAVRGQVEEIERAVGNIAYIRMKSGNLYKIEIVLSPKPEFIQKAIQIFGTMLSPIQQVIFSFRFSAALNYLSVIKQPDAASRDWAAFVIALFASWIGPGSQSSQPETDQGHTYSAFLLQQAKSSFYNSKTVVSQSWFKLLSVPYNITAGRWFLSDLVDAAVLQASAFEKALAVTNGSSLAFDHPKVDDAWSRPVSAVVTCALHLYVEELKLDIAMTESKRKFSLLMGQLVRWLGWSDEWTEIYTNADFAYDEGKSIFAVTLLATTNLFPIADRFSFPHIFQSPPNILASLYNVLTASGAIDMPTLYDLYNQHRSSDIMLPLVQYSPADLQFLLDRSAFVVGLFKQLSVQPHDSIYQHIIDYAFSTLHRQVSPLSTKSHRGRSPRNAENYGRLLNNEVERFPECIIIVLKEAMLWCQENTPTGWTSEQLEFVGRRDLKKLVDSQDQVEQSFYHNISQQRRAVSFHDFFF